MPRLRPPEILRGGRAVFVLGCPPQPPKFTPFNGFRVLFLVKPSSDRISLPSTTNTSNLAAYVLGREGVRLLKFCRFVIGCPRAPWAQAFGLRLAVPVPSMGNVLKKRRLWCVRVSHACAKNENQTPPN